MFDATEYTTRVVNNALKTCGFYPLRPVQLWLVDTHFNKINSTMMNIGLLFKLHKEHDMEKLAECINEVLNRHDIFRCRFVINEGTDDFCQRFDGEIIPAKVEKISDEEFLQCKVNLKQPYKIVGSPLYKINLFETPSAKYMYLDFYHAIMDGTAVSNLFLGEVDKLYGGKKILEKSLNYSDFILDELRVSHEELAEGNNYWREVLEDFDEKKHLPPADITGGEEWTGKTHLFMVKSVTDFYFKSRSQNEEIFFLGAVMLSIAKLTGASESVMSRIHDGRKNIQEKNLMGTMFEQIPIRQNFDKKMSVEKFFAELEKNINIGVKYRRSLGIVYSAGLEDECATFNFQKKNSSFESVLKIGNLPLKPVHIPQNKFSASENSLDIEIKMENEENYLVILNYDASRYSENAMKNFADIMEEVISQLKNERRYISEILGE